MAALVTNAGEEYVVDKLMDKTGSITTRPEFIGWGTGAAPTETSTTLTTEVTDTARATATISKVGTGDAAVYRAVGTLTATQARTITEVGLFTASSAGTLVVASDITSTVLATGEGIQFTIDINPE
jgi:hypothetical protein